MWVGWRMEKFTSEGQDAKTAMRDVKNAKKLSVTNDRWTSKTIDRSTIRGEGRGVGAGSFAEGCTSLTPLLDVESL